MRAKFNQKFPTTSLSLSTVFYHSAKLGDLRLRLPAILGNARFIEKLLLGNRVR